MFEKSKLKKAMRAHDLIWMRQILQKAPGLLNAELQKYNVTPLSHAICLNSNEMTELLIELGARVGAPCNYGPNALWVLAAKNKLDLLKKWHAEYPGLLMQTDGAEGSLLHKAAAQGHKDVVMFLLVEGLNPLAKDYWGRTPIDLARRNNGAAEVVEILTPYHEEEQRQLREKAARVLPAAASDWRMLDETCIAHVRNEMPIGYRITEIFNFSTGERTRIYRNLETSAESVESRPFDRIDETVVAAHSKLTEAGGTPSPLLHGKIPLHPGGKEIRKG